MFKTRDECLQALARDKVTANQPRIDIFYQASTDTFRYAMHSGPRPLVDGETLYAALVQFPEHDPLPNQRLFRPISKAATDYFENNPLPGNLIFGTASYA